jgi:MobA/MobL family
MVHFYMRRDVYKSGGHEAAGRVAYITRKPLRGTTHLDYISQGREDCLFSTSRNLPGWCQGDARVYFADAERYEGAGWVAFEELKIGLPVALTHRQNLMLLGEIVDAIAGDRLPATYAMHVPRTMDGRQEQPHFHMILSRRQIDAWDRPPAQHFRRYNAKDPAKGGAQKDQTFAHRLAQRQLRVMISDLVNLHLERAGRVERVHPGKLQDRGIDRTPEPKLRPSESRAYREKGTVSTRMAAVLATRATRQETRDVEQADAQAYWEARKGILGITDEMDAPAQLAAICQARAAVRDHAPTRAEAPEVAAVALSAVGWEAYHAAWAEGQALWQPEEDEVLLRVVARETLMAAREGVHVWSSVEEHLHALAVQLEALGGEGAGTGVVRIRLWEEKQGLGI